MLQDKFTVKQARLYAGFTQKEISRKMGVDVGTYRRIEEAPEKASVENAKLFCTITGIPIDKIFFAVDSN